jgi:polysaccharide pyruvyl transferase WcaK-like protein
MDIEVHGPYLGNLGDALMVRAIMTRLGGAHRLVLGGSLRARGLRLVRVAGRSRLTHWLGPLRKRTEVGAVLDCSGYAYGAPWGRPRLARMAANMRQWRRQGIRVIFLPQAFGPFSRDDGPVGEVLRAADRIYARDEVSLAHLRALDVPDSVVRLAPDFTCAVPARLPAGLHVAPRTLGLVPNHRMLDQTSEAVRRSYRQCLVDCASIAREHDLAPLVILHEENDRGLAEDIRRRAGIAPPVLTHADPGAVKAALGACHMIVASRYHAQVAGLSQGVPVLGTSWTHKYPALFAAYACPDRLLALPASRERLAGYLAAALREPERSIGSARLRDAAREQRRQTEAMWRDVETVLAGGC